MSWCDRLIETIRRPGRALSWAVVGSALILAAGCGFRPLYAEPDAAGEPAVEEQFAAVRIVPLPNRAGQQMHNLLRDRLNPRGQPLQPRYLLDVDLVEAREDLGIRVDETATRANLTVIARFILRDAGTKSVLYRSDARSTNSFNIVSSQFATDVAEDDARERGLREVADSIRTRLGIYFARASTGEI